MLPSVQLNSAMQAGAVENAADALPQRPNTADREKMFWDRGVYQVWLLLGVVIIRWDCYQVWLALCGKVSFVQVASGGILCECGRLHSGWHAM